MLIIPPSGGKDHLMNLSVSQDKQKKRHTSVRVREWVYACLCVLGRGISVEFRDPWFLINEKMPQKLVPANSLHSFVLLLIPWKLQRGTTACPLSPRENLFFSNLWHSSMFGFLPISSRGTRVDRLLAMNQAHCLHLTMRLGTCCKPVANYVWDTICLPGITLTTLWGNTINWEVLGSTYHWDSGWYVEKGNCYSDGDLLLFVISSTLPFYTPLRYKIPE